MGKNILFFTSWILFVCFIKYGIAETESGKSNAKLEIKPPTVAAIKNPIIVNLTRDEIHFIVDYHNQLRGQEGSSNMEHMIWNPILAEMGQEWAAGCWWGHGNPQRDDVPFEHVGQNIYFDNDPKPGVLHRGIEAFYVEKEFYNYDTLHCSKPPCGHYTQVTWASSTEIGCGLQFCPNIDGIRNVQYVVCNYGPSGNWQGQKPFKKGDECSQCESGKSWCSNGLCRDDCTWGNNECKCLAQCHNCGKFVKDDCSCLCDVGWYGGSCREPCEDTHENCGANPGWPSSWCIGTGFERQVYAQCPALCGRCQKGTSNHVGKCPVDYSPDITDTGSSSTSVTSSTMTMVAMTTVSMATHSTMATMTSAAHRIAVNLAMLLFMGFTYICRSR